MKHGMSEFIRYELRYAIRISQGFIPDEVDMNGMDGMNDGINPV